jgi:hypothetical protein
MNPLVCLRCEDVLSPPVQSQPGFCDLCGADVWVAVSSPHADAIWCWQCAGEEIRKSERAGDKTTIARPTPVQLADLAAYWNKR